MSPTPEHTSDDLSALAWVHEELRRSLDAAHKALRRFLRDNEALGGSDVDAVDPSVLRQARTQIHQGVGALELVGQPAAAAVLRASEGMVQRVIAKPHRLTSLVVEDIERASFALLDYLSRLLANKPVSALSLFPQYRAVQEAAGADRVHPADLWTLDWQWRDLPSDPTARVRHHDSATHAALESLLLPMMRATQPVKAADRMSELCAGLGSGATTTQVATLWRLAAGVFEAQSLGLLGFDVFSKRVASRLLAQYRILERGESDVSERLAQDLLFFCAQSASPGDGRKAPRLAAVRQAYDLARHQPVDYTISVLGRFDPAVIAQARKRVVAAKEAWSAVAGGEMHRLTGLSEQFALVGESLKRLFPLGDVFAAELQHAVAQTQTGGAAPAPSLAMEVATSLLYVEAALEDGDFDHPDQAARVTRLAERLAAVRQGQPPQPLEGWMEELYRRVSDRQTMGSVVQELRASLSEAEKLIDQYFRDPADRQVLIPVPQQLSAMRGVLSVLGMDHASAALLRMRDEVDALAADAAPPDPAGQPAAFDRLAGNLGALGFLIDMLSVQPQLAKSLFSYDPATGDLVPVMGRAAAHAPVAAPPAQAPVEQRLIEQAQLLAFSSVREDVPMADISRDLERLSHEAQVADQPTLAAAVLKARAAIDQAHDAAGEARARGELSEALVDFVATSSEPAELPPAVRPAGPGLKLKLSGDAAGTELAQDDDMREVFLEEAREVIDNATAARAELAQTPEAMPLLTTLRRDFHTLKGSSRMVGLKDFGEAAWACEQLYNTLLADQSAASHPLLEFTQWCLDYFNGWVGEIQSRQPVTHDSAVVVRAARRLVETPATAGRVPTPSAHGALAPALPETVPAAAAPGLVAAETAAQPPLPPLTFQPMFAESGHSDDVVSDPAPLDLSTPALQKPFDAAETLPLPVLDDVVASSTAEPNAPLDLELELDGLAPAHALPIISVVAPTLAPHEPAHDEAPPLPGLVTMDLHLEPPEPPSEVAAVPATADEPVAAPLHAFVDAPVPAPADAPQLQSEPLAAEDAGPDDEPFKSVGPLRISTPLFNIYLNEAEELSRRLSAELGDWALELHRPLGETPVALAHSLAGSSATVGFADLSHLARSLEHAEARSHSIGQGTAEEAQLFVDAAEEIRRLLHQFAAGFLKAPSPELLERLAQHELSSARRLEAAVAAAEQPSTAPDSERPLDAVSQGPFLPEDEPPSGAAEPEPPRPQEAAVSAWGTSSLMGALSDSTFDRPESRFDRLGVTEFRPLAELPSEPQRPATPAHALADADDSFDSIDATDAVDVELFPIFEDEAAELLPLLASRMRDWAKKPDEAAHPAACMRTLHTLKGAARLAGAMRLGELAHRLETRIEHLLAQPTVAGADVEALLGRADVLSQAFDALRAPPVEPAPAPVAEVPAVAPPAPAVPESPPPALEKLLESAPALGVVSGWQSLAGNDAPEAAVPPAEALKTPQAAPALAAVPATAPVALPSIDWSRFAPSAPQARKAADRALGAQSSVRVRAPLLDRLVNQAGEVSITRSRIESGVTQIKTSLTDLTENLERLRAQLRDIEFHGEVQMSSRLEAAKAAAQSFDPLEFDRFTRFQELTRMMAESVNDVGTVQRSLQRSLEVTEDELVAQARMTRELQEDLLRTRMVEFEGLSERLYRVVRQAAKETGKSVRLDIVGGSIEVDRGVLDRMTGSFEHLLRNCVSHGIESPQERGRLGKDPVGSIVVSLSQEANEVGVEFRDDGAGLNLARIRTKGVAMGLIDPHAHTSDADLANLIFAPGFSTADTITELSGRGVGMDVVRSDVSAMGGRVETATAAGQGTSFRLILPLTTAVTQVVMLRCGETHVAVPSTLVEVVRRATPAEVADCYASGAYTMGERSVQFFWLGALLQLSAQSIEPLSRALPVVVIRSAQQRIALHVDEVLGNQEVVVKNLGPQLSRLPGLAGVTLLASGSVALIYNPVALATLYGEAARQATQAAMRMPAVDAAAPSQPRAPQALAPLVMVVDDSLTVRRVTQRLLLREGYRVILAKDGLDALERLGEAVPQIVLSDIEMPRMDGFDLVRNMRADARLRDLPVIMITSRIAQKHRDYAAELGVDHYLGKPYSEEDLLALIAGYTRRSVVA